MVVYQLSATGDMFHLNRSPHTISSKHIYTTRVLAESNLDSFRKSCVIPKNEYDLTYLDDNATLKLKIIELELVEE